MAGHSHWAQIKRKKAVNDNKRGAAWAKLLRGVEIAARDAGTSNPSLSDSLFNAIDRAKSASVPNDNIERAAKRGAGELEEKVTYERVVYEGYGPSGAALLVEAYTENRNRTGSDIRATFSRGGGNMGEPGSVGWMFERKGVIVVNGNAEEDEVLLAAADAGADDIRRSGDAWEVVCEMADFAAVKNALTEAGLKVETADLTMVANTTAPVDVSTGKKVLRLMDALDALDDVQNVYVAADIPEEVFLDA